VTCAAVIPVRNRPSLIVAALASVQRQTRPVDEIVVVDDGSTDATPDIVAQMSRDDARIRLVALPRSEGASAARNAGIGASQSEWISFLDSDDLWLPRKQELQLRALMETPDAVASFSGIRHQGVEEYHDRYAPARITLQALRRLNYLGTTSTATVRRSVLQEVGGFDASLPSCQDWDLWIKLRCAGDFAIVPEPLVVFNQTERTRISNSKAGVLAGHAELFARTLNGVRDPRERRKIAAYHQLRLSQIYHWDLREPGSAVVAAMKSMALCPTRDGASLLLKVLKSGPRAVAGRLAGAGPRPSA
jgi:glycosyltransferase involved in cell wall biosynthesis